jgi:hypothetical protein
MCGTAWPCAEAKGELLAEHGRTTRMVYLAALMGEAMIDLPDLAPGMLYDRFLSWPHSAFTLSRISVRAADGLSHRTNLEGVAVTNADEREAGPRLAPAADTPAQVALVGLNEIHNQIVEVTRERVLGLTLRDDFPEPMAELGMGDIWFGEEVAAWIGEHTRDVLTDMLRRG